MDGDVVLVWKSPSTGQMSSCRPKTLARMQDVCQKMGGWDTFLVLNKSKTDSKPSISDITEVRYVMLDFDPVEPTGDNKFPLIKVFDLLRKLGADNFPIISSGRGTQLWVAVRQDGLSIAESHYAVKAFARQFSDVVEGSNVRLDMTCADVSRIVRCPGTVNHKNGNRATINVTSLTPEPVSLLPWFQAEGFERLSAGPVAPLPEASWRFLAPRLHHRNLGFLLSGTNSAVESRHGRAYNCAKDLHGVGVDKDGATRLLYAAADKCVPNLNLSDPRCIERMVAQVWT